MSTFGERCEAVVAILAATGDGRDAHERRRSAAQIVRALDAVCRCFA